MSCLLQHPAVAPFHYSSQSSSSSSDSSSVGLVMDLGISHEARETILKEPFSRSTLPRSSDTPIFAKTKMMHPPEDLNRTCGGEGSDSEFKNEAFFPQQNSPVEHFKPEPLFYQNGFHPTSSPVCHFLDDLATSSSIPISIPKGILSNPILIAHPTDIFSLKLKLELENYIHKCGTGEQFQKFRGEDSPPSSLSCSTTSLASLAPTAGAGSESPTRRHSFSATVSNSQSTPGLSNHLEVSGIIGGSGGTASSSGCFRQRSHTYSSSSCKPHPYPMTKRQAGWHSFASSSSQVDLRDRIEGLRIRPVNSMSSDEEEKKKFPVKKDEDDNGNERKSDGSSDRSQDTSRKGSVDESKLVDPESFLFLGPFGKKRMMVRERQKSLENVEMTVVPTPVETYDQSPQDISVDSPLGSDHAQPKDKVEDIVEEDESIEVEIYEEESNEPLNLSVGHEPHGIFRDDPSTIYSSHPSLDFGSRRARALSGGSLILPHFPPPPDCSVLRNQLLGIGGSQFGPTSPQYQTRERSVSMSAGTTLPNRLSVIKETRVALAFAGRPTVSPPPEPERSNGNKNVSTGATLHLQTNIRPSLHLQTNIGATLHLQTNNANSTLSLNSSEAGSEAPPVANGTRRQQLECQDCHKKFSQLRNYRYHRSRHEGTSQFACVCPVCHKKFNDKGYLSSHLKIHTNAKEYKCEYCGKCFNQRVAYNMHVRIHTGLKPHQCELCDKAFSRRMLLKQHLRIHTGDRPYKCSLCGKAFADRSNMLLHQRLHSGVRPFICDICQKSFSKNHHLKTHLNHHAGIKPYQCSKCKATFSQSSNMKTHFRKCTAIPTITDSDVTTNPAADSHVVPNPTLQAQEIAKIAARRATERTTAPIPYRQPNAYNFQLDERYNPSSQRLDPYYEEGTPRNYPLVEMLPGSSTSSTSGLSDFGPGAFRSTPRPRGRGRSPPAAAAGSIHQLSSSAPVPSMFGPHPILENNGPRGRVYGSGRTSVSVQLLPPPPPHPVNLDLGAPRRHSDFQHGSLRSPPRGELSPERYTTQQPPHISPGRSQHTSPQNQQSSQQIQQSTQQFALLQLNSPQHRQRSPHRQASSPQNYPVSPLAVPQSPQHLQQSPQNYPPSSQHFQQSPQNYPQSSHYFQQSPQHYPPSPQQHYPQSPQPYSPTHYQEFPPPLSQGPPDNGQGQGRGRGETARGRSRSNTWGGHQGLAGKRRLPQ